MIKWIALPSFIAPFPDILRQSRGKHLRYWKLNSGNLQPLHVRTPFHSSVVILGGSSGVGKEIAKYLEAQRVKPHIASRSRGYDFLNEADALRALHGQKRVAVSVGAGRKVCSLKEELELYQAIASALSSSSQLEIVTVVLRALVVPEVKDVFQRMVNVPWVFVRPGPLVDREQTLELERTLVTTDIRCNGLVSRAAVGRVIGDLLLDKVPIPSIARQIIGVYDLDRMINHPRGVEVIGKNIWQ